MGLQTTASQLRRIHRGAVTAAAVLAAGASTAVGDVAGAQAPRVASHAVLLTANSDVGTITLIDAGSLRVMGTLNIIPDGSTPQDPAQAAAYPVLVSQKGVNYAQGIAVSPDGQTVYVSRGYLGDVAAFDLAGGRLLWRLQVSGLRADHVALSPDGSRLFVSALTANEVQVIDTRTHAFVGSFATGDWPHVLEFSPDGRLVYNGSLGNQLLPQGLDGKHQLTVADPNTLGVVRTFQFPAGVRPFVIEPNGRTAFVQLSYLNGFDQFDLASGQVVRTVALPVSGPGAQMTPQQYPNQAAHHGIALSDDGRYVCDAGTISNYVALVGLPALTVAAIIPVGDQPAEALTSLDGRYCFVTDRGPGAHANAVSVISYAQRREIARIPVGQHPMEEEEASIPDAVLRAGGYLRDGAGRGGFGALPTHRARPPACRSRRRFIVHFRRRGTHPKSLLVLISGQRPRHVSARPAIRIDLRGRRGTVRVRLVARVLRGRRIVTLSDTRTYHLCRARQRRR